MVLPAINSRDLTLEAKRGLRRARGASSTDGSSPDADERPRKKQRRAPATELTGSAALLQLGAHATAAPSSVLRGVGIHALEDMIARFTNPEPASEDASRDGFPQNYVASALPLPAQWPLQGRTHADEEPAPLVAPGDMPLRIGDYPYQQDTLGMEAGFDSFALDATFDTAMIHSGPVEGSPDAKGMEEASPSFVSPLTTLQPASFFEDSFGLFDDMGFGEPDRAF
jgi:hypothetical protein